MAGRSAVTALATAATLLVAVGVVHGRPSFGAQPGKSKASIGPLLLKCELAVDDKALQGEAEIKLESLAKPTKLDQKVTIEGLPTMRIIEFIPRGALKQDVQIRPDGKGVLALQVSINGSGQSVQRWVFPGRPPKDKLASRIARWRCIDVEDKKQRKKLYKQFANELDRPPRLMIYGGEKPVLLAAAKGSKHEFTDLGATVRVLAYHPHFGRDSRGKIVNLSTKPINPATLVEIETQTGKTEQWVFTKFPNIQMRKGMVPLRFRLDCEIAGTVRLPDFVIVTMKGELSELWSRIGKKTSSRKLKLDTPYAITPGYNFHIAKLVKSGELIESYTPTASRRSATALKVEIGENGKTKSKWLALGSSAELVTDKGTLKLSFAPKTNPTHGKRGMMGMKKMGMSHPGGKQ